MQLSEPNIKVMRLTTCTYIHTAYRRPSGINDVNHQCLPPSHVMPDDPSYQPSMQIRPQQLQQSYSTNHKHPQVVLLS